MKISLSLAINARAVGVVPFLPTDLPNLKIWLKPDGLLYNGGNLIHEWTDASGNGNSIVQATETNKPLRVANLLAGYQGARFDGVDNFLRKLFTWTQPETVYIVFNSVTWTVGDGIFDGDGVVRGLFYQVTTTPSVKIHAGLEGDVLTDFTLGNFHIGTIIFNGASSFLQHNNGTLWEGAAGANNMAGFTLGSRGNLLNYSNIEVMEIIGYDTAAHTADDRTQLQTYLNSKYSVY